MNELFIAFVVFGVIDLTFVGLTCYHVIKHLKNMSENMLAVRKSVSTIRAIELKKGK